jgi:hypothetical protein
MKGYEQLVADYLQPQVRPDLDAGTTVAGMVALLNANGWHVVNPIATGHLRERVECAQRVVLSDQENRKLVSDLWFLVMALMQDPKPSLIDKARANLNPPQPRHLGEAAVAVYCAALTGLYAGAAWRTKITGQVDHGWYGDEAMAAVEAFIERTK